MESAASAKEIGAWEGELEGRRKSGRNILLSLVVRSIETYAQKYALADLTISSAGDRARNFTTSLVF